ncbi:MAG: nucleotide sugar dehydrogenase [Hyphomicrobiales bacterium]|jgi:UDP-N-acetyl-D-galactosamine dehydrogenase
MKSETMRRTISVTGLGYVGLPVAIAFARKGFNVVAFDVNTRRVEDLRVGHDSTREVDSTDFEGLGIFWTTNAFDLASADFHIITVPTPITEARLPDLGPLKAASRALGSVLKNGDIVVYESTVYPGATREVCVPILEVESGLTCDRDFSVGYSPERINPGDRQHRFETITKVVSASTRDTLDVVARTYGAVVEAGIFQATSIEVAEAAKVIENTQRDLNIALMNELALIFDKIGIRTNDVLKAARTKWNFLPFTPGLVGGHCIGVDPYYLTHKAEICGYHPEVILAGRRTNDGMGAFIARKLIKLLVQDGRITDARVGVLGLTFKEDVPDLRNSRVPDIIRELSEFGIEAIVHDPLANVEEAFEECAVRLSELCEFRDLDALILAVPHQAYLNDHASLFSMIRKGGTLFDVKSACEPAELPTYICYWSL